MKIICIDLFLFEKIEREVFNRTIGIDEIYYTSIFVGDIDQECFTVYSSKNEAKEGHNEVIRDYNFTPGFYKKRITPLIE